jgi:hypothetical protein
MGPQCENAGARIELGPVDGLRIVDEAGEVAVGGELLATIRLRVKPFFCARSVSSWGEAAGGGPAPQW